MSANGMVRPCSCATVAAIGAGDAFSKGRDFAAWLGLVPRPDHQPLYFDEGRVIGSTSRI